MKPAVGLCGDLKSVLRQVSLLLYLPLQGAVQASVFFPLMRHLDWKFTVAINKFPT